MKKAKLKARLFASRAEHIMLKTRHKNLVAAVAKILPLFTQSSVSVLKDSLPFGKVTRVTADFTFSNMILSIMPNVHESIGLTLAARLTEAAQDAEL